MSSGSRFLLIIVMWGRGQIKPSDAFVSYILENYLRHILSKYWIFHVILVCIIFYFCLLREATKQKVPPLMVRPLRPYYYFIIYNLQKVLFSLMAGLWPPPSFPLMAWPLVEKLFLRLPLPIFMFLSTLSMILQTEQILLLL